MVNHTRPLSPAGVQVPLNISSYDSAFVHSFIARTLEIRKIDSEIEYHPLVYKLSKMAMEES